MRNGPARDLHAQRDRQRPVQQPVLRRGEGRLPRLRLRLGPGRLHKREVRFHRLGARRLIQRRRGQIAVAIAPSIAAIRLPRLVERPGPGIRVRAVGVPIAGHEHILPAPAHPRPKIRRRHALHEHVDKVRSQHVLEHALDLLAQGLRRGVALGEGEADQDGKVRALGGELGAGRVAEIGCQRRVPRLLPGGPIRGKAGRGDRVLPIAVRPESPAVQRMADRLAEALVVHRPLPVFRLVALVQGPAGLARADVVCREGADIEVKRQKPGAGGIAPLPAEERRKVCVQQPGAGGRFRHRRSADRALRGQARAVRSRVWIEDESYRLDENLIGGAKALVFAQYCRHLGLPALDPIGSAGPERVLRPRRQVRPVREPPEKIRRRRGESVAQRAIVRRTHAHGGEVGALAAVQRLIVLLGVFHNAEQRLGSGAFVGRVQDLGRGKSEISRRHGSHGLPVGVHPEGVLAQGERPGPGRLVILPALSQRRAEPPCRIAAQERIERVGCQDARSLIPGKQHLRGIRLGGIDKARFPGRRRFPHGGGRWAGRCFRCGAAAQQKTKREKKADPSFHGAALLSRDVKGLFFCGKRPRRPGPGPARPWTRRSW